MTTTDWPKSGECRCGATTIEVAGPPFMTAACHCEGCQRMSGSAFALTAMFRPDLFRVTEGDPIIGGARHSDIHHYFCPDCMTWMFSRMPMAPDFVNVRPTLFDDTAWFRPFIETVTAEKLAWAETPAPHSYAGFPDPANFPGLVADYAAWAGQGGAQTASLRS
ncbi:GFA family protein [Pseudooceanicola sp. LIPI14-2-Ac024]|uniref:GFA family protein n=1 Tax=Pseudooceanicola sp. LIPI14-2-Ac024 TaxID=3344875 RepID=UPI0035CFB3DB